MPNTINPLPSFIRASAQDAANRSMAKGGRKVWNEDDYNAACETQERLTRSLYGWPGDNRGPDFCFVRFHVAEQLERAGKINMQSDILAAVAEAMDA